MSHLKKSQIIFSLLLIFFIGCSPIEKIETETLQPAEISFPKYFKRIGFLFSYPENNFELVDQENFKKSIIKELKLGIAEITDKSPRFKPENIYLYNINDLKSKHSFDTLNIERLDDIADSLFLDGLIILDHFSFNSELKKEYKYKYSEEHYYINFKITSKTKWKIYSRYGNTFIDSFSYVEPFVWEALASTKREALINLPDYEETFREAAYWTGHDYATRVFPIWEKNERIYYARGNKVMKTAKGKVENNNWREAIYTWKQNLTHYDDELVSRSAYNIAIAFEMLGKIDLAMKWAKKAYEINGKERAMEYYEHLKKRKEELSKLEKQLP